MLAWMATFQQQCMTVLVVIDEPDGTITVPDPKRCGFSDAFAVRVLDFEHEFSPRLADRQHQGHKRVIEGVVDIQAPSLAK